MYSLSFILSLGIFKSISFLLWDVGLVIRLIMFNSVYYKKKKSNFINVLVLIYSNLWSSNT